MSEAEGALPLEARMILGLVLMIIGAMLIYRNRDVAMFFGRESRFNRWGFMTSAVRQNVAVVGTIFLIGGLVFFVLF
jgi:hypothetical protein